MHWIDWSICIGNIVYDDKGSIITFALFRQIVASTLLVVA